MLIKDRCIGVFDLESPELERVHQGAQGTADAAGESGGGRDRERTSVRGSTAQRGTDREGAAVRAARAAGAAADRAADDAARRRRRRPVRAGARARRRPARLSDAGAEHAGGRRRRRVGQGRAGGALRRVCRRARPIAHVAASIHARPIQRGRRAAVDEHDSARAAARGVLLHAVLRVLRLQAPIA